MGVISRKLFPACESMCVCCPALRSRSRQPVKRYKKLLADIFPKTPDGHPNDRKIVKLCEYASKNPIRIPKIAKYLEERCYKELRTGNIKLVSIVAETYNRLLCICKEQMAYFSVNLLNVVAELLDDSKEDTALIIGCDTLTAFIYRQVDGTYTRNVENFVGKVCVLARKTGDGSRRQPLRPSFLRAASLRCLSAMVWFMAGFSHIFADFEKIVHASLDNYDMENQNEDEDEGQEAHHNWVDEVARCEGRSTPSIADEFGPSDMIIKIRLERKDPSLLTREEFETPKVWAQICIQRMVDLAKETSTMRRVLEPFFVYFDMGRHWDPQHGLAPIVLSDLSSFMENPGYQQLVLAGVVRHLDHKNVAHDAQMKCHIIKTASFLASQIRLEAVISDMGFVNDLFRHLRKSFQATAESPGEQELNVNAALQTSIETCLLETVRGIVDVRPLFDMMAITLEKLYPVRVVARAALASLTILAHVISVASVSFRTQQVFPDALFMQLLKIMLHADVEIRVGGHQIFCILLIPSFSHTRSDTFNHQRRWHSKSASTFSSITALLEKLRVEIYGTKAKPASEKDDCQQLNKADDEWKHGRSHKSSPNMHIISSIVDRANGPANLNENEQYFLRCNEDQIAQLLSALWIQVNLADNLPANIEAIGHSFCLALISSRLKDSNDYLIRFFQLSLSIRKMSLDSNNGSFSPAYQRLLLILSTAMMVFAAKLYRIAETQDLLNLLIESDVDPYIGINDDFQVFMKPHSEVKKYGSPPDNDAAFAVLAKQRDKAHESDKIVISMLVEGLSTITKIEPEEVDKKLLEGFIPDESFLFGAQLTLDMDRIQRGAHSKESQSFDGEFSANSLIEDDAVSISSVADISRFIPKVPTSVSPSMSHIVSVGQLLESALEVAGQVAGTTVSTSPLSYSTMTNQCEAFGTDTRKKLSNWLTYDNQLMMANGSPLPSLHLTGLSAIEKIPNGDHALAAAPPPNSWLALRLPPASPFDNFLRAARG